VTDADEIMLSTAQGQTVRTPCKDIAAYWEKSFKIFYQA